jgi:DNA polymerase I
MEFPLCPGIPLETGTFNVIVADERLLVAALSASPELRRFMFLYVCGNYSRILANVAMDSASGFDVRRAFTAHQLVTIIREAYHTIVFIEHDPGVYEGAADLVDTVARALKEVSRESLVILYADRQDYRLNRLMRQADRVFYFTEPPHAGRHAQGTASRRGRGFSGSGAQRVLEGI